jgi:hypothetical protein
MKAMPKLNDPPEASTSWLESIDYAALKAVKFGGAAIILLLILGALPLDHPILELFMKVYMVWTSVAAVTYFLSQSAHWMVKRLS